MLSHVPLLTLTYEVAQIVHEGKHQVPLQHLRLIVFQIRFRNHAADAGVLIEQVKHPQLNFCRTAFQETVPDTGIPEEKILIEPRAQPLNEV